MSDIADFQETIYALASGKGRAGVAVVRISGPAAGESLRRISEGSLPPPRRASLRRLHGAGDDETIDHALVLWMPGPDSFTGEDIVELHVHGGGAVLEALFAALGAIEGLRLATPGEFSLRAFHNNRMDLTAAEGLNDLVWAETEAQRRQALRQMEGELGAWYESWRERLIGALAHIEAAIDFSDEELPEGVIGRALAEAGGVHREILSHLDDGARGQRIRSGFEIVITGAPNVGKSSLLNALAKEDVAIVSDIAGTTRDVVEVRLNLGGYMVDLVDTAGLREARDAIEAEGVRRARLRAGKADLRLVMESPDTVGAEPAEFVPSQDGDSLRVINKIDLATPEKAGDGFAVSARTGEGIPALLAALERIVVDRLQGDGSPSLTRARHREALEDCARALAAVQQGLSDTGPRPLELVAEDVRLATRALGRITGRVDVESVLDVVFSDFCIGK